MAPTLRRTPSHYLRPTPSHRVVWPQPVLFSRDAYVGLVWEYVLRRKHHLTTLTTIFYWQPWHGTVRDEDIFGESRNKANRPTINWALRKQTQTYPTTIGDFRSFNFPRIGIGIPHQWIDQTTTRRRIQCLSPPQQVKNTQAWPMRLFIAWVRIIESEIDPMIPAPSNYEGFPRNGHNEGDETPSLRKTSQWNLPGEAHWRIE